MIKIENTEVMGWHHAIRGMRNPKNSWNKSDSLFCSEQDGCDNCPHYDCSDCPGTLYSEGIRKVAGYVGDNDHTLMMNLAHGGPVHAKYRRMITVYLDITAPLYWWKEFDTYKVGTVANSCSTMHKIHAKPFELSDFSTEHLKPAGVDMIQQIINLMNGYRIDFNNPEAEKIGVKKDYWWQMIQLLPSSYNQKRTVMLSYEVLVNMYESRKHHKLDEWREFCKWIESLPYSELITGERETNENA